jgi:hypothetical protein
MAVSILFSLTRNGFDNSAIAVSDIHCDRAARRVNVPFTIAVIEIYAFRTLQDGRECVVGEHVTPIAFGYSLGRNRFFRCCHESSGA